MTIARHDLYHHTTKEWTTMTGRRGKIDRDLSGNSQQEIDQAVKRDYGETEYERTSSPPSVRCPVRLGRTVDKGEPATDAP